MSLTFAEFNKRQAKLTEYEAAVDVAEQALREFRAGAESRMLEHLRDNAEYPQELRQRDMNEEIRLEVQVREAKRTHDCYKKILPALEIELRKGVIENARETRVRPPARSIGQFQATRLKDFNLALPAYGLQVENDDRMARAKERRS